MKYYHHLSPSTVSLVLGESNNADIFANLTASVHLCSCVLRILRQAPAVFSPPDSLRTANIGVNNCQLTPRLLASLPLPATF